MQSTWNASASRCSRAPTTSADCPADARVHLVEDQRLARRVGRRQRLQRQHDPRQLAARGDARQRPQVLAGVGRDVELRLLDPPLRPLRPRRARPRSGPRSASGSSPDSASDFSSARRIARPPARRFLRQRRGQSQVRVARASSVGVELGGAFGRVLDVVQLAAQPLRPFAGPRRATGRAFFFRRSSSGEPVLDLLQRAGDASMPAAYERRKNARSSSCDFTAVARLEVRREARVERGEIAEPSARRCRAPAAPPGRLRTARVGVGAQPLQLVGVGEHLPRRGQLLVLAGAAARRDRSPRAGTRGTPRATAFSRSSGRAAARARRARCCQRGEGRGDRRRARRQRRRTRRARSRCADGIEQQLMLVLAVQIDERRRTDSRSAALVASAPSTNARLRPCAEISRRTIISRPSGVSKIASTAAVLLAGADEVG